MSVKGEDEKGAAPLKIKGSMSINEAAALREEWLKCLNTCDGLSLDLGDVADCDAAGIQLLCAAIEMASRKQKPFRITAVSPSLSEALDRAGLCPDKILNPKS